MKRSTSRLLSTLLVLCMVLALMPGTAWGDMVYSSHIRIWYDSKNMVEILTASQTTPLSGEGWSYEPTSKTLILDGYEGRYIEFYEGNESVGSFTLELRDTNTLSSLSFGSARSKAATATITGSGSIVASLASNGMDIVMKGGTITTDGKGSYGVSLTCCNFHMTGGTLNATGERYGISLKPSTTYSSNSTTFSITSKIILEGGTVTAYGDNAAIWIQWGDDAAADRTILGTDDMLDFGGRTPVGGRDKSDRQVLSVQEIEKELPNYADIQHITSLTSGKMTPGTETTYWEKEIGAAKYAYISGSGRPLPPDSAAATAYPSTQTVDIDGKKVEFQMYALKDDAGNPTNYVKIRDLALAMNGTKAPFSVDWNGAVNLVAGRKYTPNGSENKTPFSGERKYRLPSAPTNVNGKASDLVAFVLTDDKGGDYTYYQLRDLGEKLGFNVSWTPDRGIYIESDKPYVDERQ